MRFIIICAPRTGSSHLVNILSGHPDFLVNGNVFDNRRDGRLYVFWPDEQLTPIKKAELLALRDSDPAAFVEHMWASGFGRPHVGFKIFERENDELLSQWIGDNSIRKIVLYRRNVLANFASAMVARKTGRYSVNEGKKIGKTPKIAFNARKFASFHAKYTHFFADMIDRMNDKGQPFFLLNYEDINDLRVIRSLVTFIGGDATKGLSKENQFRSQLKQNSSDIISRFANQRKVRAFLEQNGLMHWAHEGEHLIEDLPGLVTRPGGASTILPREIEADDQADDEPSLAPHAPDRDHYGNGAGRKLGQ